MDSAHRRREFVSTWPCFVDIEATCVMQTVRGAWGERQASRMIRQGAKLPAWARRRPGSEDTLPRRRIPVQVLTYI